jgi:hypothetical protein
MKTFPIFRRSGRRKSVVVDVVYVVDVYLLQSHACALSAGFFYVLYTPTQLPLPYKPALTISRFQFNSNNPASTEVVLWNDGDGLWGVSLRAPLLVSHLSFRRQSVWLT